MFLSCAHLILYVLGLKRSATNHDLNKEPKKKAKKDLPTVTSRKVTTQTKKVGNPIPIPGQISIEVARDYLGNPLVQLADDGNDSESAVTSDGGD